MQIGPTQLRADLRLRRALIAPKLNVSGPDGFPCGNFDLAEILASTPGPSSIKLFGTALCQRFGCPLFKVRLKK
jgi:hypothetical protein